jgi:CheY-like chemotaxis protein/anti-anti-sigma regulatory factor/c-di-GMP-binding flagellar brake protein YcgR
MSSEKKLILVIDDQKDTRDLIQSTLTNDEFSVIAAPGGREGIQLAKMRKPDIILLDMVMPRFDGVQTCALLKKIPTTKDIPVVFLTASKDREKVLRAIKAGGVDYVVKPFSPGEMIERIRKLTTVEEEDFEAGAVVVEEEIPEEFISQKEEEKKEKEQESPFILERTGKMAVMTINLPGIDMDSYPLFRNAFIDIVNDGIIRVIIDISRVNAIDGAGICLLVSVGNTLKSLGGALCITTPTREAARNISYLSLNYLLPSFQNVEEARANIVGLAQAEEKSENLKGHQICIACSYLNTPPLRFCTNCGSRLDLARDDRILQTITNVMSRAVLKEADTTDVNQVNEKREMRPEERPTPREFDVEIKTPDVTLVFHSKLISDRDFATEEQITIKAPEIEGNTIAPPVGTPLILASSEVGRRSSFETEILEFNTEKKGLVVGYTEEAKLLHSETTFSVKVKDPLHVSLLDPKPTGENNTSEASVVELSRLGMHVYSVDHIPVDTCLALRFRLLDGPLLSSALVVARRTEDDFLYNVEFAAIDEKERSKIIQYMYQCQIEQNK